MLLFHISAEVKKGRLTLMKRQAAVGIDECVNSEAVGLSCSESYVALAEKFQINARSGNVGFMFK